MPYPERPTYHSNLSAGGLGYVYRVNSRILTFRNAINHIYQALAIAETLKVAVVGGSPAEPELVELAKTNRIEVHFFGVEEISNENWSLLDLNHQTPLNGHGFDFVLCSQVLEHIWHVPNAFLNFNRLLRIGGHLWVACPFSNFYHGSPDFYSTGYSPNFIDANAKESGFQRITSGFHGTRRDYVARHLLNIWLTEKQIMHPMTSYYGIPGSFFNKIFFNFRVIPYKFLLLISSKKNLGDIFSATESYGLYRK